MSSRNEMSLILVGINHKTADISLREKVAFPPEIVSDAFRDIRSLTDVSEVVVLSTCNRTELYIKRIEDEILSDKLGHSTQNSSVQKTVKDVVLGWRVFMTLKLVSLSEVFIHCQELMSLDI